MSANLNRRRGAVPYALPASHKGYSAYSRETYTAGELQYRGKTAPVTTPEEKTDELATD